MGERIDGLDVARALAVLGMFGAHVGDEGNRGSDADGWGWLVITHGYPSALFAVLAGVSMTLMATSRATVPITEVSPQHLYSTRVRIAVRAGILILLGFVMDAFGTPVIIILTNLGVMTLIGIVALTWRTRWLVMGALICAALGGAAAQAVATQARAVGLEDLPVVSTMWSEHYSVMAWMAFIWLGMALARLPLRDVRTMALVLVIGAGVATGAALTEAVLARRGLSADAVVWVDPEPHVYTPLTMTASAAAAGAVIALCLMITPLLRPLVWPLAATGSMALTAYVSHIVVIAAVGQEMVFSPSNVAYVVLSASVVAFCCAWRAAVGAGPLERMLTATSSRAARAALQRRGA